MTVESAQPRIWTNVTGPFPLQRVGSGNETKLVMVKGVLVENDVVDMHVPKWSRLCVNQVRECQVGLTEGRQSIFGTLM